MRRAVFLVTRPDVDLSSLSSRFPSLDLRLARTRGEAAALVGEAEILILNGNDCSEDVARAVAASKTLKWIQFTSSGMDGALRNGLLRDDLALTNAAGLRAANLAEHAFALLLFLTRRLRAFEQARAGQVWSRDGVFDAMESLCGRGMLIVGMGAIGRSLARKARAFDMRVEAVSRAYVADDLVARVYPRKEAQEAFRRADAAIIAAPSEQGTRGLVDARVLAAMKRSSYLINVSRGDIVDEDALAQACRSGRIAGAGLDVMAREPLAPTSELWRLPNVVVTPHVGGAGSDQFQRLLDMVAENLERYLSGAPLLNRVSLADDQRKRSS